ncbi:Hypothetical predicted protein [Olea europaea subsp. europaea]|uniref:Uncharacterized protein n=1 Tax=Olea europaea subsp. europaea TaxID=158383 RepID=A0A8S0TNM6_OLEEU|nr:Hypothetical predicted protein [Olea europaea subsp. europaea]
MAKCIGSVNKWTPKCTVLKNPDFLVADVRQGDSLLKKRVESSEPLILDIANDYFRIKQSALADEDRYKLDCSQTRDSLTSKLEQLLEETTSVVSCISSSSSLIASTKHRYFIQYTYGVIEKLEQLMQIVGRLSEIDQTLFLEEQRQLLISDHSITLHSMVSIWTAAIEILKFFCRLAPQVFNSNPEEPDEYDFLDQLEFSSARVRFARALLMDFTITSWIKFNHLVKYEDLIKGLPFLCQCQMKTFFNTLLLATNAKADETPEDKLETFMYDTYHSILDHQCRPSMMTMSARRFGIIPLEPCHAKANQSDLAYFLIWHIYSVSRYAKEDTMKHLIEPAHKILYKSFSIVRGSFIPSSSQVQRLSPHQEERFKLLFYMLSHWIEKFRKDAKLLCQILEFAKSVDGTVKEANYMDNKDFTINGLTLFHLFTKLFNDTIPDYGSTTNGDNEKQAYGENELKLIQIWNGILDEHLRKQGEASSAKPPAK